jgi:hypothetical protein
MLAPSDTINKLIAVILQWRPKRGECSFVPGHHTPVEQSDLLPRRMTALGLDANTVAWFDPATFRDLERLCARCEYHELCRWHLKQDHANPIWQKYCPNWATLDALGVLPWSAGSVCF